MKHPLAILFLVAPLGAGAQNIGLALFILSVRHQALKGWGFLKNHKSPLFWSFSLLAAFLVFTLFSTLISPVSTVKASKYLSYTLGNLAWLVLPFITKSLLESAKASELRWLWQLGVGICFFMGLICLSQMFTGWQRFELTIIFREYRARGFYSHPLTVAYVAILLWPIATGLFLNKPKDKWNILFFLGVFLLMLTSRSRTVQAVGIMSFSLQCFFVSSYMMRRYALIAMSLIVLLIATTRNPISEIYRHTLEGTAGRETNLYADDRLAFWHAHWLIIKEFPVSGVGIRTPSEYLADKYAQIGLPDFEKKYNAHNQFIQYAASFGLVGLFLILAWLGFVTWYAYKHAPMYYAWTLVVFSLANLSQNAINDSEVRFVFSVFLGFLFYDAAKSSKEIINET
jgi:O-antigen ligase